MFKRCPAALFVLPSLMSAQFFRLSTRADGSRVYFATPLKQKNMNQPDYGKLFRFDAALALQESRTEIPPASVPGGIQSVGHYTLSNAYNLTGVSVSSDGATLAAAASRDCAGDTVLCPKREELVLTTITGTGQSREFEGTLRLSANGKWAFGNSSQGLPGQFAHGFLVDLSSGVATSVTPNAYAGFQVGFAGRPVADDGTAVYCDSGVVIYQTGSSAVSPLPRTGTNPLTP